jgi:hypothetical protein
MKKSAIKLTITSFIFLLINCNFALANEIRWNIGVSYFYANINDSEYDFVNKYETIKSPRDQLKSISVGLFKSYRDNNFNWSINTNRLFNNEIKRSVKRKSDNLIFQNETKITTDSFLLGYKIKRFNPSLIVSNIESSKFLYYNNSLVGYENKRAIVPGINLGYFATKNFVPSFSYILPNKELDLEGAFSLNINYIF